MAKNLIYWKRKGDRRYKMVGLSFNDKQATMESANMLSRGLDVKIEKDGKVWFDSRVLDSRGKKLRGMI